MSRNQLEMTMMMMTMVINAGESNHLGYILMFFLGLISDQSINVFGQY